MSENAALGPGVDDAMGSVVGVFVDGACRSAAEVGGGGGSIPGALAVTVGSEIGSGNKGIDSSSDDVSMVICLVLG